MDPQANPNILKHKVDRYDAATIDVKSLPNDPNQFQTMLAETLSHFNTAKVRGVWLTIDINRSALIPIAIKQGFRYHHTKKDYVLLTTWIPKGEISKLPHYAGYFVGVGGVVINDETDEILVIQEKTSIVDDMWKVPGGLADDGEYISQAGEREVFEETGIKAKFQSLICFREKLNYKWNAADIYFVCLLKPETFEIKIDPGEIKTARWMKIDEYLKLPNMVETQKKIAEVVALRKYKGIDKIKELSNDIIVDIAGFTADEFNMTLGDRIVPNNMFYGPEIAKKLAQQKSS